MTTLAETQVLILNRVAVEAALANAEGLANLSTAVQQIGGNLPSAPDAPAEAAMTALLNRIEVLSALPGTNSEVLAELAYSYQILGESAAFGQFQTFAQQNIQLITNLVTEGSAEINTRRDAALTAINTLKQSADVNIDAINQATADAAAATGTIKTYSDNAKLSEQNSKASETASKSSENASKISQTNSKTSETNSKASETNAESSRIAIVGLRTDTLQARDLTLGYRDTALTHRNAAETAANTATTKASEVSTNATAVSNAKTATALSETNAKTSEDRSKVSEVNAKTSETNAKNSETTTFGYIATTKGYRDEVEGRIPEIRAAVTTTGNNLSQSITYRDFTYQYMVDAKQARDEAQAIVGSDFYSKTETNERLDKKADLAPDGYISLHQLPNLTRYTDDILETDTRIFLKPAERTEIAALRTSVEARAFLDHTHTVSQITDFAVEVGKLTTSFAKTNYVDQRFSDLIGQAPEFLNQMQEFAQALGNDPNAFTTLTNAIATKAPIQHTHVIGDVTGLSSALKSTDDKAVAALEAANAGATQSKIQELIDAARVGEVIQLAGPTLPTGKRLLRLNGASLNRVSYAALWAYVQNSGNLASSEGAKTVAQFGPGDGSNTFTLPDFRGMFIRAFDDGKGVDAGRNFSQVQASQNLQHEHAASMGGAGAHAHGGSTNSAGSHTHSGSTDTTGSHTHSGSTASAGTHSHNLTKNAISTPGSQLGGVASGGNFSGGLSESNVMSQGGAHSHSMSLNDAGAHSHGMSLNSAGQHSHSLSTDTADNHTHTLAVAAAGGAEARPTNIATLFAIYY